MISQAEFERRVSEWWELVFSAQDAYAQRMHDAGMPVERDGDAQLTADMAIADAYEAEYLPEDLLAHFLDPISPPGTYDNESRADVLLRMGAAQRMADDHIRVARKSSQLF